MFMHFSCLLTSIFIFSFFYGLRLCFCSVLSLSLSNRTSLWHPNRENPFQLETLFKVLGHPLRLFTDFVENFQDCDVHSECQAILSDFSDTTLPVIIRTQGWESLCEKTMRCPIVFMQEFYSNIHGINTSVPQFTTQFRGTRLGAIQV